MKVLIISSSPRKGGNSELLARAFAQGLQQNGHMVTMISAGHMKINGCLACDQCYAEPEAPCIQKDDFWKIYPMLLAADMVVLVSPLYFFNMTTQLKAVIDRMYAFCRSNQPMPLTGKKSVLMMTGASSDLNDFLPAIDSYKLTADYLKWEDKGIFIASDVWKKDDILKSGWLEQVLAFGQSL